MTPPPTGDLVGSVHKLLDGAGSVFGRGSDEITDLRARLDGPLRVAIAGKLNAGKSTLLNALVGEKVAPTDATECTRVVTMYRNSHVYSVRAVPYSGDPVELRFKRTANDLEFTLGDFAVDDVQYVDVGWPTERLRDLVLIDTPGLASVSDGLSERTRRFLSSGEAGPGSADAVIYLMRHLHETDLSFLEAFKGGLTTQGATVNSIAVISRADEIGAARTNAMDTAERIANRYRADARINAVCQVVIPVAGLIAQAAATLRQHESNALRTIAAMERGEVTELLLSAHRFLSSPEPAELDTETRGRLLGRLGLFGVRLGVELIAARRVQSAGDLAAALEAHSGIRHLRSVLNGQFAARASVLKARSTLATLSARAALHGGQKGRELRDRVRDVERAAHELVEIRLLAQLRSGAFELTDLQGSEAEARRVLGDAGAEPNVRMGLPPATSDDEVRAAALDTIGRWRSVLEDPFLSPDGREVAQGVVRSCEAVAVRVSETAAGARSRR